MKILRLIIASIIVTLFCSSAVANADNWALVCENEEIRVTADLSSMKDMGETFKVREKYEYLTNWTKDMASLGKKEKIYFSLKDVEYKKNECAYKVISQTDYNAKGVAVATEKDNNMDWQYAVPTSSQGKSWEAHTRFLRFKQ